MSTRHDITDAAAFLDLTAHDEAQATIEVKTPSGSWLVTLTRTQTDDALVVFIDSQDVEPTPDVLRLNVNDGPAWNYPEEGTGYYGDNLAGQR